MPSIDLFSLAFLNSGMMTIVGFEEITQGAWYGVGLRPLETISLRWTLSCISLAEITLFISDLISSLDLPGSREISDAPWKSLSKCSSINTSFPLWSLNDSQTPSPNRKPESKTETFASFLGKSSPFTDISTSSFQGSSSYSCVPIKEPLQ